MEGRNFLTILGINIRLNIKHTLFPAAVILAVIPFIYGISNLDSMKSADCLERMVVLIGIPLFVPILKIEQDDNIRDITILRNFPYQIIVLLRVLISIIYCTVLVWVFEMYMTACGSIFPIFSYMFCTIVCAMILGSFGILLSSVTKNTVVGYLGAFCLYFVSQSDSFNNLFRTVSEGVTAFHLLFIGISVGIVILWGCNNEHI